MLLVEHSAASKSQRYHLTTSGLVSDEKWPRRWSLKAWKNLLAEIFLPQGYPHSVSDDYLKYQMWDTLQAFCSSLAGAFSTRALLIGAGVGDADASPLAATMIWLARDGTGLSTRVLLAWSKGHEMDVQNKQWRLAADVANDVAMTINLVAAGYGQSWFYGPLLCVSSATTALVSVAGHATRVTVQQHQARRSNLADVAAKDGSQESMVNLAALLVSLGALPLVENALVVTWILFLALLFVHIYANFYAVTSLKYTHFNRLRAKICWERFRQTSDVPSVIDANVTEPIFPRASLLWNWGQPTVHMGISLKLIPHVGSERLDYCWRVFDSEKFIVVPTDGVGSVFVVFKREALPIDELCAFLLAVEFADRCARRKEDWKTVLSEAKKEMDANFFRFFELSKAQGWEIDKSQLGVGDARVDVSIIEEFN